jgi:uncharacterized protein YggE
MRTKLFLFVPVLILALVLSACGTTAPAQPRTLVVSGNGTVSLTPDIAYVYIGVHTENADIAQALAENNTQAQAVVDALKGLGVAAEDIQTSSFNVYSSQKYDQLSGQQTGNTYSVDNTLYVTVRDLPHLGSLLNTVVSSGANNINSIQFDVADKTAALAQARQKAMENASSLAGELAQTAGVSLGEIQSISYTEASPYPYYGMGGGSSAPNPSVPIQVGQLQISVTVSVSYAIR